MAQEWVSCEEGMTRQQFCVVIFIFLTTRGRSEKFCFRKLVFHAMTWEQGWHRFFFCGLPLRELFIKHQTFRLGYVSRWGEHKSLFLFVIYAQTILFSHSPNRNRSCTSTFDEFYVRRCDIAVIFIWEFRSEVIWHLFRQNANNGLIIESWSGKNVDILVYDWSRRSQLQNAEYQ